VSQTLKNADLKARKDAATPRGVGVMCDFYAERAENAELWDVEGRRFIDFAAGIAVCNTGHRHPKIVAAMRAQLERFTHTAYQIVPYESYVSLAEKIIARALPRQFSGADVRCYIPRCPPRSR
jgi:4-aminobutyrate aminotransferase-like enzyme